MTDNIEISYELLKWSIRCSNITLCRSILEKTYEEKSKELKLEQSENLQKKLEKKCLSQLKKWRKKCLPQLIEQASKASNCTKLALEWISYLEEKDSEKGLETKIEVNLEKYRIKEGFTPIHLAFLLEADGVASSLIEKIDATLLLTYDLKDTVLAAFLRSETLFEKIFTKLDQEKCNKILSYFKGLSPSEKPLLRKLAKGVIFKNATYSIFSFEEVRDSTNKINDYFKLKQNTKSKKEVWPRYENDTDTENESIPGGVIIPKTLNTCFEWYVEEFAKKVNPEKSLLIPCQYNDKSESFIAEKFELLLLASLTGNPKQLAWVIHKKKATPNLNTLVRIVQACWYLEIHKTQINALDTSLQYLLKSFSIEAKDFSIHDLLSLATLELPKTFEHLASVNKHKNFWAYILKRAEKERVNSLKIYNKILTKKTYISQEGLIKQLILFSIRSCVFSGISYLHQHSDEAAKCQIKKILVDEMKYSDNKDLVEFVLHQQILSASDVIKSLVDIKPFFFPRVMQCQLIALNQWAQEHTRFKGEQKKLYDEYLEKVISKQLTNLVHPSELIGNLYHFIHELFYFQKYPALVSAMGAKKRDEVTESLCAKLTEAVEKAQTVSANETVTESDTFTREWYNIAKKNYSNLENDRLIPVKLDIGGLQMPFSLGVGFKVVELCKDRLLYQQLFKQICELQEDSTSYQSFIKLYKSINSMLANYKNQMPEEHIRELQSTQKLIEIALKNANALERKADFLPESPSLKP